MCSVSDLEFGHQDPGSTRGVYFISSPTDRRPTRGAEGEWVFLRPLTSGPISKGRGRGKGVDVEEFLRLMGDEVPLVRTLGSNEGESGLVMVILTWGDLGSTGRIPTLGRPQSRTKGWSVTTKRGTPRNREGRPSPQHLFRTRSSPGVSDTLRPLPLRQSRNPYETYR